MEEEARSINEEMLTSLELAEDRVRQVEESSERRLREATEGAREVKYVFFLLAFSIALIFL